MINTEILMKFYKLAVAVLVAAPVWAMEIEHDLEMKMEKLHRDGEQWACIGDAMLMLAGDFKGTTRNTPGVGAIIVNGDFENPRGSYAFLHGLSTRVWIFDMEESADNQSSERESFIIEATFKELINNLPVKGEYGRIRTSYLKDRRHDDVLEYSEFNCQRFDGWRVFNRDGQHETVYPTQSTVPKSI